MITYQQENLTKHDVTEEEVDEAISNSLVAVELPLSARLNNRVMLVGFTMEGRLLEVGVKYLTDEHEHFFHAMDATKEYRRLFAKSI